MMVVRGLGRGDEELLLNGYNFSFIRQKDIWMFVLQKCECITTEPYP